MANNIITEDGGAKIAAVAANLLGQSLVHANCVIRDCVSTAHATKLPR